MNINYFDANNEKKLVHTVNGTALAVPRIMLLIFERFWDQKNQRIDMPEVLKPFLPFDRIEIPRRNIILR